MGNVIKGIYEPWKLIGERFDERSDERRYKDSLAGGTSLETVINLTLTGLEFSVKNDNPFHKNYDD